MVSNLQTQIAHTVTLGGGNHPCVEIGRFVKDRNLTLNLLIGKDCVLYYNFVGGSSNMYTYSNFWEEAAQNQDEYGRAVLIPGDFVVVDNCPIHRNNSERVLRLFFGMQGVQYGFLPVYSPDFNPVENCFLKLKKILSQEKYLPYIHASLKFAITQALKEISLNDIRQFYLDVLSWLKVIANRISQCMTMQFECVIRVHVQSGISVHVYQYFS